MSTRHQAGRPAFNASQVTIMKSEDAKEKGRTARGAATQRGFYLDFTEPWRSAWVMWASIAGMLPVLSDTDSRVIWRSKASCRGHFGGAEITNPLVRSTGFVPARGVGATLEAKPNMPLSLIHRAALAGSLTGIRSVSAPLPVQMQMQAFCCAHSRI